MSEPASSPSSPPNSNPGMTRRTMLASSAMGAVTMLASSSFAQDDAAKAATAKPKRNIKRALKFNMVAGGTILEKFKLLKELGYDGTEIDSPTDLDIDEIIAARDATGVLIPSVVDSVHWNHTLGDPNPEIRAKGRAGLETALKDAKRVGATTVLLVPAVVNEKIGYDEAYTRSQAEVRQVLPLAKETGVKIAFENVWNNFLLSPLEAARYVDEFGSDMVGWHLDIGNLVNYAWPEQWARILKQRVLKLDFKEFSRKKRNDEGLWKGFDVEMLDGDNNWPAVMAALDEIGYQGWASAEVPGGNGDRLKDILSRMDRILAL